MRLEPLKVHTTYDLDETGLYFRSPKLSVLSVSDFRMPDHLGVNWHPEDGYQYPDHEGGEFVPTKIPQVQQHIEFAGRLCYMSQHNPAQKRNAEYIGNIRQQGHGSVFEHASVSILFEGVSRTFSHELVRHRAGWAYSQVSQRYVDEADTLFVCPPAMLEALDTDALFIWANRRRDDREEYQHFSDLLYNKYSHITDKVTRRKTAREAARNVLPNCTETKIVATANLRAWRTMLELRCNPAAEREIRRAMVAALRLMQDIAPAVFDDFNIFTHTDGAEAANVVHHKV